MSTVTDEYCANDASSPEPRTCPYLGKFTVTGVNRNQRNIRESRRGQHQEAPKRDKEKVRHAQERTDERRGRRIDFEGEKRRANNEYLVHERMGRRARSNRGNNRNHRDYSLEEASSRGSTMLDEPSRDHGGWIRRSESDQRAAGMGTWNKIRRARDLGEYASGRQRKDKENGRGFEKEGLATTEQESWLLAGDGGGRDRRNPKMEDFQVDMDDFAQMRQFWVNEFEDSGASGMLQVQEDYFGDYPENEELPKKRSYSSERSDKGMTYRDLVRMRRDLEELDGEYSLERREKREEDESRCNSEVTTLTVGCSTADRMEFQSDCVDDDAITAYSCHGRWFDAEGTQFVIATPLARRATWASENNRPQPYRNSRRLCFMYKESGGVVSLTASPVACQRGIPPPPPMLAFNATSTGQCIEENSGPVHRSAYLTIIALSAVVAIFR
ncbi:hypothetical protein KM043_013262 [Ampulex compressa]|nr:hypothetical protein KM043_013262 [Ampulex compressa]